MSASRNIEDEPLVRQILGAMRSVATGAKETSLFVYGDFGERTRVSEALSVGSLLSSELQFYPDEVSVVRSAFARVNAQPPSDTISLCCRRLMESLLGKQI